MRVATVPPPPPNVPTRTNTLTNTHPRLRTHTCCTRAHAPELLTHSQLVRTVSLCMCNPFCAKSRPSYYHAAYSTGVGLNVGSGVRAARGLPHVVCSGVTRPLPACVVLLPVFRASLSGESKGDQACE